ncbi:putative DNA polymerase III subunits gamma and tau-like protein [Rosellinia necatrix]|uniref:Putative DNA polymerase III subunits gamma and tau-like protein n=1 Tax=Rosellinia necatrix TaxID=77044 RepID=A0A1W2TSF5_ROSNE|nr:putative DNA polymerase III subunits gamma and tau-like protein [Rosellinia necatrix]
MMSDHQWPEAMRKRARDEEDDGAANGPLGFTEHRNKRLQALPLRVSMPPTHRRWTGAPNFPPNNTITPSNSDSDSEDAQQNRLSTMPPMDVDQDADMAMESFGPSNSLQPDFLRPDAITPNIAARMPTPIHCTFAAQVRGNSWGAVSLVDESGNATILQSCNDVASPQRYLQQDPSVPRSLDGSTEWSMVQNRRLPSPISENGGEDAPTSPGMVLDNCSPVMAQLQRPCLPHMTHSMNPHTMPLHPNIRMSPQPSEADAAMMDHDGESPSSAPPTPSPRGKFGHSRSKHTLNSWTLQPGMKKSFSIGYRADCEKCRLKIPGHFNHIIIS